MLSVLQSCLALASAGATLSCASPARQIPPYRGEVTQPVIATAPAGVGDNFLGAPLDAHFRPLQGPNAGTLFPGSQVTTYPLNQISHETVVVTDTFSLDANISAWNLFGVGGGVASERRFATYRAFQIEYVTVLNDRMAMASPPLGAAFYPWKIYYGHAYEAVFSGTSQSFHAGIAAEFQAIGGDIQSFARTRSLEMHVVGRGLVPSSGHAIFARTPNDVRASYAASGPAVPIFVEYRMIPGLPAPARGRIAWAAPLTVEVVYDSIDVIEDGTWGTTLWNARAFCAVNAVSVPLANSYAPPGGMRVEDGKSATMNWHASFSVVDGDRVDCGLEGSFRDTLKSGNIAVGRMALPLTIRGPGMVAGLFEGSNADTRYKVHYRIFIRH